MLTDVRKGATQIATITYLADGTKVKVKATGGAGLLYRGRFIYRFVLDGLPTIESVEHDHGRFLPGNSANEFIDTWHVRDYLGSTRAVFDITPDHAEDLSEVILEQNDYCLFGSRIDNADLPTLAQNRFRFNGKEKLIAGANDTKLTDYGARMYSAPLARWTTPDPLADKYYSTSPYPFSGNNPVNFVDPDGKAIETAWDIASIGLGIGSLVKNIKDGNIKGAIGDGLGIAADVVAAAVPFLPGGVGYIRNGGKALNMLDAGIDALRLGGELKGFEKASEFGVDSYKNLKKSVIATYGTGSGLEVHHLVEKRFAKQLGMKEGDMPSIVLTKEEHKKFTAAWREQIGYKKSSMGKTTDEATKEDILNAAKEIYKDSPELLKAMEEYFK